MQQPEPRRVRLNIDALVDQFHGGEVDHFQSGGSTASSIGLIESLLEGLPSPVFVKDEDRRWVLLNTAFCDFMGRARGELIGKSDADFFPPDETPVFWATDDQVFAGAGINENEEQFTDSCGRVHTVITRKSLHIDEQGRRSPLRSSGVQIAGVECCHIRRGCC